MFICSIYSSVTIDTVTLLDWRYVSAWGLDIIFIYFRTGSKEGLLKSKKLPRWIDLCEVIFSAFSQFIFCVILVIYHFYFVSFIMSYLCTSYVCHAFLGLDSLQQPVLCLSNNASLTLVPNPYSSRPLCLLRASTITALCYLNKD